MSLLALEDREAALAALERLLLASWRGFDRARDGQPPISGELRERLERPLPERGIDAVAALELADRVLDASIEQPRPRYLAYVGSSGLEIGVLGDALMAAHDVNVAVSAGGADLVERQVVRWVAELVGFGPCGGVTTSGGTLANLTALTAARERAVPGARRRGLAGRRLALYCSAEAHYSVVRAAEVLGIGSEHVRAIPVAGARRAMDPQACAAAIDADRAAGIVPVAVVATAGTTLTGAVDRLDALAGVCAARGVWLHVDGAYGLPAAATETAGALFAGLDRADSATVDAHKWLFVPKACSILLMRDPAALHATFSHQEAYIPHMEAEEPHAVDQTLEYSRPLRALKLWLAFTVHGAAAVRAAIEGNLRHARLLAGLVRDHPDLELACEPVLSAVCFRHRTADNARLVAAVQADARVYLAGAHVDGADCLRACFVNFRTTDADVAATVDVVAELAARAAPRPPAP
ncbi:MAG: aspartate aminotransferase family protein [Solirubrobacteraceae bacterium]|nr:aspartate aminotransferase family protein [Solirubrobacteraceae bacterium]